MLLPARFLGGSPYASVRMVNTEVQVGTGATSIGNSGTTSVSLPKPACTECQLLGIQFTALVAAASAGTVSAQVFKRDNSGTPANRTLTATKSLLSDIVTVLDKTYPLAITSTSIQNNTFQSTDTARIDLVASGTVSTQPTVAFSALWAIIKP